MSKEKTILFDFTTYKHRYSLKQVVTDLVRLQKYSPNSDIVLLDLAKTRLKIEDELYCNLPVFYSATYNPHTILQLADKLIDLKKSYIVVSSNLSFFKFISDKVAFLHMESDTSWIYWDKYKFKDKHGYDPHIWQKLIHFENTLGLSYSLENPDNKSVIVNLFTNFSNIDTAVNYLKEEIVPREKWLVDAETKLIELCNPPEENLIDFVSYNYTDNVKGFSELLDSLEFENKESILDLFNKSSKFKTS